ncbi:hypothetical protein CEP52_016861 [Fusarium oligoseptatum]|uniref:Peptidase C14 caspase domain-containing protein n=1 Tax=Fusarium oligoseptatum TaxID=2604345 RepID=A0A428RZG4_9HYPO|nr:hypothetical protein CEP52_016861 [Fusarium oligoseptatum]
MTRPRSQQRFALLVGIDRYLRDGRHTNLEQRVNDLQGCVNDVNKIHKVLRDSFQVKDPILLTSTNPQCRNRPLPSQTESPDSLPTFDNIKREFDKVYAKCRAGDVFYFHFSGHGAPLDRTTGSPARQMKDPSLLTVDYCTNEGAIRGWQLNEWLKRFHDKGVLILVTLDSCYSGGSWRFGHQVRTLKNWGDNIGSQYYEMPSPSPSPFPSPESTDRSAVLPKSWDINPDGFTVMTACDSNEGATEMNINGEKYGLFTYELVNLLAATLLPTYRVLCDRIAHRLSSHRQTPQVFGRDRFGFLDDHEPFILNPIIACVQGNEITIPMGRSHGVHPQTEFKAFAAPRNTIFQVRDVDDWECRAVCISGPSSNSLDDTLQVVPSKWGLGREGFQVFVDMTLDDDFRKPLRKRLEELLAGSIEVLGSDQSYPGSVPVEETFRLIRRGVDGVGIHGPPRLLGYTSTPRDLDLRGTDKIQLAERSAAALGHLVRFKQVLVDVPKAASRNRAPFEWSLDRTSSSKIRFNFKNIGGSDLFLTVFNLAAEFSVEQLYPPHASQEVVAPDDPVTFDFDVDASDDPEVSDQREIIRIIVTTGERRLWACLEMPTIGQVDQMESRAHGGSSRKARLVTTGNEDWWIRDEELIV